MDSVSDKAIKQNKNVLVCTFIITLISGLNTGSNQRLILF